MVLIGSEMDGQQADRTRRVIEMIAKTAQYMNAVIICGGIDTGVMAEIGRIRGQKRYKFPLVGIVPEQLVTWPSGPHSKNFLWWGNKRWRLESHYSHFILVSGSQFGDESPSINSAATLLSNGHQSVTILISGGEVARKDIQLSLENGRQVIERGKSCTGGIKVIGKSKLTKSQSLYDFSRPVSLITHKNSL